MILLRSTERGSHSTQIPIFFSSHNLHIASSSQSDLIIFLLVKICERTSPLLSTSTRTLKCSLLSLYGLQLSPDLIVYMFFCGCTLGLCYVDCMLRMFLLYVLTASFIMFHMQLNFSCIWAFFVSTEVLTCLNRIMSVYLINMLGCRSFT